MSYTVLPVRDRYHVYRTSTSGLPVGRAVGDHGKYEDAQSQATALEMSERSRKSRSPRLPQNRVQRILESTDPNFFVTMGSDLKTFGDGRIGGHLVLFGTPETKDFSGDYFTPDTYLGPNNADGRDVTINHRLSIKTGVNEIDEVMDRFTSKIFKPGGLKTRRDELGIFGEVICNLSDAYDQVVYDLASQGKLKWSSGAARHMIDRDPDGQLKMFVVAEAALTPAPMEPRMVQSKVMPLKSFVGMYDLKGGKGSGNFGHKGRKGERGGSDDDGMENGSKTPSGMSRDEYRRRLDRLAEKESTIGNDSTPPRFQTVEGGSSRTTIIPDTGQDWDEIDAPSGKGKLKEVTDQWPELEKQGDAVLTDSENHLYIAESSDGEISIRRVRTPRKTEDVDSGLSSRGGAESSLQLPKRQNASQVRSLSKDLRSKGFTPKSFSERGQTWTNYDHADGTRVQVSKQPDGTYAVEVIHRQQ